jgi:hypothetical protein
MFVDCAVANLLLLFEKNGNMENMKNMENVENGNIGGKMGESKFRIELKLDEKEKDEYINFLLRQYRLVDAFWFLGVEDRFGLNVAVELNEEVWEEMARRSAREIKRRFKLEERGLKGFIKALKYFPWATIVGYEVERTEDGRVVIKVPHCPPQEARLKSGKKEFPCKEMHYREFKFFAKEIDERIEVECIFAPPDERRDIWCMWEFKLHEK